MTNPIGRPTIHPVLFYSGKLAGYLTWILLAASLLGVISIGGHRTGLPAYGSYCLLAVGLVFSVVSMINLGRSMTLGLPAEPRPFRSGGLYRLSRNPMYLGFDLLTLASVLYHANVAVAVAGIYSIFVYHLIIRGEERYLQERFGETYARYRGAVRRYL